ncbi:sigma-70 family RNA polymerase sigma factor [Lentzea flava]|uniref:RNA polymerase sigma-D factor n=1 Tax=Lentzea flava TaxID=103732 RepID=A0ABQ2V1L2_9PSEU|nr:sigma-70 family RNA polymerase sigma factor [Lentzea flava]MCP2202725.1 RNA polymerase sigma-70 factor, ECF subfamily [Lentzea flava]GGU61634.1 putative RNA polymerase sigma-D factor [Lentzea flava]
MISDDLVRAATGGDRQATAELFAAVRPLVTRYVRRRVAPDAVEDITQDVCERLFAALPSYRNHGRPFMAFVCRIALNRIIDVRRSAAHNLVVLVDELPPAADDEPGPEQLLLRAEQAEAARLLLDQLTDEQRTVVVMRIFGDMSFVDIATVTDSNAGAVKALQHRALDHLRKRVARSQRRARAFTSLPATPCSTSKESR